MRYTDWYKELQATYDERDIAYITHRMQSPSAYGQGDYSALASPFAMAYDFDAVGEIEYDVPFPPTNRPQFTFIDLFAGIGGIRLGFEKAGGKCVFSSEIDKDACKTYQN